MLFAFYAEVIKLKYPKDVERYYKMLSAGFEQLNFAGTNGVGIVHRWNYWNAA